MNPDSIELPSAIGYADGDSYANGEYNTQTKTTVISAKASGTTAYFLYNYQLKANFAGTLRTSAEA